MSPILAAVFIVIAVVVLIVILLVRWVVSGQNKLVHADELCGNALSQIGVQQTSRWDALTSLADLTKTYSDQEYNTLMDVIRARQGINPKSSAADADAQETMIQQSVGRVSMLAESYPDLKSNTLYLKTMEEVKNFEDKVRISHMVYNDSVTKFNRLVRALPGSFVAGGLGFAPRDYLQADAGKTEMPNLAR